MTNEKGRLYFLYSGSGLTHVFPGAAALAAADLDGLGIVGQRIAAIREIGRMIAGQELHIDCTLDTGSFVEKICGVKGIGEWTARYIAMRALNDPNAFPHSDLILRRAAANEGETLSAKQLLARAEGWQPWRAYSVILLWRHYQATHRDAKTHRYSTKR